MINFDDEAMSPASQWLEFMKSLPDDRGSWEMTRIPMSSSIASSGGGLHELELVQNQMDCINGKDEKVKSFYRSKTVIAVNQHKKTVSPSPLLCEPNSGKRLTRRIVAYVPYWRRHSKTDQCETRPSFLGTRLEFKHRKRLAQAIPLPSRCHTLLFHLSWPNAVELR